MLLDDNNSVWVAECPPYEPREALSAHVAADIAVVGGGLTGVSVAQHLAQRRPDLAIILLEGRSLGNGASGRNGGMVLNYLSGIHLPEDAGEARPLYETFTSTVDAMRSTIAEHQLDVELDRCGSFELFTSPRRAEAAARQTEVWNRGGLPLRFFDVNQLRAQLNVHGAAGAIFDPKAGQLNALRYVRAMREVLERSGVRVFENTMVRRIREGRRIEVETNGGTATVGSLFLATNAYSPQLGYFRDRIMALHSHVIATTPVDQATLSHLGWPGRTSFSDDLGRLTYGSVSAAGRIVMGGGSNAAYAYRFGNHPVLLKPPLRGHRYVHKRLLSCFADAASLPIEHRWSGPLGITATRVPLVGVRGDFNNIYYGLGYSGSGITAATLVGRVLADLYVGDGERWAHLPGIHRRAGWLPPEPWRWLGYQVYTALTRRSRSRAYRP